jgi:hypothetical protein
MMNVHEWEAVVDFALNMGALFIGATLGFMVGWCRGFYVRKTQKG